MNSKYWVVGDIVSVDASKDFWFLSCKICGGKVELVDGVRPCAQCGVVTYIDIYRYKVEVMCADESGSATLVLCDEAATELIGQTASSLGAEVKRLPDWIQEKMIVGRKALFEVVTSEKEDVESFDVCRLTVDEEIFDLYLQKYIIDQDQYSEVKAADGEEAADEEAADVKVVAVKEAADEEKKAADEEKIVREAVDEEEAVKDLAGEEEAESSEVNSKRRKIEH
ncbi:hypothetical protein CASFOL_012877 [Castilleja foliolosa]|uniref:Replication factor A C-terminal domain-containing protein n=1 Tax=Castilleja foliolosa TaxID=1961234 RepID=A0ABD3DLN6_9LAMI